MSFPRRSGGPERVCALPEMTQQVGLGSWHPGGHVGWWSVYPAAQSCQAPLHGHSVWRGAGWGEGKAGRMA